MEFFLQEFAAICFFVKIPTEALKITVFFSLNHLAMKHFFYSKIILFESLS